MPRRQDGPVDSLVEELACVAWRRRVVDQYAPQPDDAPFRKTDGKTKSPGQTDQTAIVEERFTNQLAGSALFAIVDELLHQHETEALPLEIGAHDDGKFGRRRCRDPRSRERHPVFRTDPVRALASQ